MKSQHFCTKDTLERLKDPNVRTITTYRTGWIPSYKKGEIIRLNERDDQGNDTLICHGKVIDIKPLQLDQLPEKGKIEIERYNRNFHEETWFFKEIFKKIYNKKRYLGGFKMEDLLDEILGDNLTSRFIKKFDAFDKEKFMFSISDIYNSEYRKNKLKDNGIHTYVKHDGPLMLDSGGFQLIKKHKDDDIPDKDFDINQTLEIYKLANLKDKDFGITLDLCPLPDFKPSKRREMIQKTNENYLKMKELAPKELRNKIVHVIHGWSKKEIELSLSVIKQEDPIIAIGSCFPLIIKGYRDDIIKKFVNLLHIIDERPELKQKRFHVLGANGANSSHICWYAGLEQTDSSSWRRIAAYGKIVFVGVSEVSLTDRKVNFGNTNWTKKHDRLLRACECPVCEGLSLNEKKETLKGSFKSRSIHNAYHYLEERNIARELVGTSKYYKFLEKRFKKNWLMKKFLKKIREAKFQPTLDEFLKPKRSGTELKLKERVNSEKKT
jgi:tRNA-guanine family transglycosylase